VKGRRREPVDPLARERERRRAEREAARARRAAAEGSAAPGRRPVRTAPPSPAPPPRDRVEEPPAPEAPAAAAPPPPGRTGGRPSLVPPASRRTLAVAIVALAVGAATGYGLRGTGPDVDVVPPGRDALRPADARGMEILIRAPRDARDRVRVTLDGRDAGDALRPGADGLVLTLANPSEGEHVVRAEVTRGRGRGTSSDTWRFQVDGTPPRPRLRQPADPVPRGSAVEVIAEAGDAVTARVDGRDLPVEDGVVRLRMDGPPATPLRFELRDAAGNVGRARIAVPVAPRRPPRPVRSVHVSALAWATPSLRQPIIEMIDRGLITSVELDLKDESGIVGYDARVPLARRIGAVQPAYKLDEEIRFLHSKGVWVIGRIVAFRDPVYARAMWRDPATRDRVVQTPSGAAYAAYGGFTNFAHPAVRDYNTDIAEDAARRGVDDILYDYVRRPDGPRSSMRFPGLRGTPEAAITGFLAENRRRLEPHDVFLGASVFGVAATRPEEVAQDIPAMAREVDYVAPMVYPSHWAPGEYDIADPNGDPRGITRASVADFVRVTRNTGARVVPWLQDFSLGLTYGPAEVRAQIEASREAGADEWILWDPAVSYTDEALSPAEGDGEG